MLRALVIYALFAAVTVGALACTKGLSGIIVNCTDQALENRAGELLPAVEAILDHAGPSWEDQLLALGERFGEDALACAVQQVGMRRTTSPTAVVTGERVKKIAADRKWRYE